MPRIHLPPDLVDRPFSVAEAREAGIGGKRLRGPDLVAPHRGVRVGSERAAIHDGAATAASPLDLVPAPCPAETGSSALPSPSAMVVDRALALQPVMLNGWVFSHTTALALWGLPVPLRVSTGIEPLHVSTSVGRGPRRPGVVGHRSAPTRLSEPTRLDVSSSAPLRIENSARRELPVDDPLSAWARSGALLTLDELIRAGDALAGSWSPRVEARERPIDELIAAIAAVGRVPGAGRVRAAVEFVRSGVESPRETDLRLLLVRAGLPEPEINQPTYDASGRYLGKPDLRYRWCKVAIEYEGDEHRLDRRRFRHDILRRERFADAGWRTVRCTGDDLDGRRAAELIARVERLLR
jgi:hypothetical protein